MDCELSVIM